MIHPAAAASILLMTLASATMRTLVLAVAAGVGARVLARRGAASRLRLWTVALYAALLMPVAGIILPPVRVPLPGSVARVLLRIAASHESTGTARGRLVAGRPGEPPGSGAQWAASTSAAGSDAIDAGLESTAAAILAGWATALAAVYAAGVFFLLGRGAVGWAVALRFQRRTKRVRDSIPLAVVARQAAIFGVSRVPRLAAAAGLRVPITLSVIKPTIVLPADWRRWDAATFDLVIAHEMSHIARGDAWTQRVSLMYRALAWCNPFSWWLRSRLAELAELASDEAVLEQGADRAVYAETLLGFFSAIRHEPRRIEWHIAMARGADACAERRVNHILDWKGGRSMTLSRALTLALMLAVLPIAALTASGPVQQQPVTATTVDSAVTPVPAAAPVRVVAPAPAGAPAPVMPAGTTPAPGSIPAAAPEVSIRPAVVSTSAQPIVPVGPLPVTPATAIDIPRVESGQTASAGQDQVLKPGPGIVDPVAITRGDPKYTHDAMQQKIQGDVELDIVVLKDGTVGDVTVTKSLDPELDRQAIIAAKQWFFKPATKDGQPVNVLVGLAIEFRLHDGPYSPDEEFARGAYTLDTANLVAPKVITKVDPKYTSNAMRAKLQGDVTLDVIVMPDGSVGKARITKSLDTQFGLDAMALDAAKHYLFTSGQLNGQVVPVLMSITVQFRLH